MIYLSPACPSASATPANTNAYVVALVTAAPDAEDVFESADMFAACQEAYELCEHGHDARLFDGNGEVAL